MSILSSLVSYTPIIKKVQAHFLKLSGVAPLFRQDLLRLSVDLRQALLSI
jgi:hypothetical protein